MNIRCLWVVALIGCFASPAAAGQATVIGGGCHACVRHAINARTSLIAYLEANPDIDEGDKGPVITRARLEIRRLQAMLRPQIQDWRDPCCYSRKPLYIR